MILHRCCLLFLIDCHGLIICAVWAENKNFIWRQQKKANQYRIMVTFPCHYHLSVERWMAKSLVGYIIKKREPSHTTSHDIHRLEILYMRLTRYSISIVLLHTLRIAVLESYSIIKWKLSAWKTVKQKFSRKTSSGAAVDVLQITGISYCSK